MKNSVTQEQIIAAKQIDLLTYLQTHEPNAIRKTGPHEYCLKEHDSLKISNGKWNWFSRGIGGKSALDFLVHVSGMDFVDAVRALVDGRAAPSFSFQPVKKLPDKPKVPFALPPPYKDNNRAIAYLQSRGIDREIIDRCIKDGTIYEMCHAKQSLATHNCVFVGRDTQNIPRFACLRGTSGRFVQDIDSSDKRYAFCMKPREPCRTVNVFESPVDALSLATLRKMDGEEWDNCYYLSLGCTAPRALIQFLSDHPEIDSVKLYLDNDRAGLVGMIKAIAALHDERKLYRINITYEPPKIGKDYNDLLLAVIKERLEHTTLNRHDKAVFSI